MLNNNTEQTVIAAKVAAELFHAKKITRSLSLSSQNLRILAKRIGERAAGLAVLATLYEEYSRKSIELTDHVNSITTEAAIRAVDEWRYSMFETKLEQAEEMMSEYEKPQILISVLQASPERKAKNQTYLNDFNRELDDLLTSIQRQIRSIAVIAINAKIEAPRTGKHSLILLDMAYDAEQMIIAILKHLDIALKLLSASQKNTRTYG